MRMDDYMNVQQSHAPLEELYNYMRMFDVTLDREPQDPYVVPERLMTSFVSSTGHTFEQIMSKTQNKRIERINYLHFIQEARLRSKRSPRIPQMHNNMCVYVCHVPADSVGKSFSKVLYSITSKLTYQLQARPQLIKLAKSDIARQIQIFERVFTQHFRDYHFEFTPYGSMVQGLGFPSSGNSSKLLNINIEMDTPDMNRLIYRDTNPFLSDRNEPHSFETMQRIFIDAGVDKMTFHQDINSIRIKHKDLSVEYNFNKKMFTKSTNLIEKYVSLDPRISPFLSAIKYFARGRNVLAPYLKSGGMRAYGYVIMGLAYLQSLDPPIIPNLQHLFDHHSDECNVDHCTTKKVFWDTVLYGKGEKGIAARYHDCVCYSGSEQKTLQYAKLSEKTGQLYWRSANESSVGELLIDFMYYYGYKFDYERYAVSLRAGGFSPRKDEFRQYAIIVEDPFISGVNIAPIDVSLSKFTATLIGTFTLLYNGQSMESIIATQDIGKYEDTRGLNKNNPRYASLRLLKPSITNKTLVVIGLPKVKDQSTCYCEQLMHIFSQYGTVRDLRDLDFTTKQFTIFNYTNCNEIAIPSLIEIQGKPIHVVELYDM
ncbi:uncharacterized protein B0P05DRAFT_564449 [Gilbertella persicaria]|uniref:uncharacterized protein n=1 Tax=Gilbertella persicaria TaxID=101096 RepID=UPI00221EED5B|nr:uncharacterized protein B0P05DRAFT_564449 [Gilbertella persicaria]KAI8048321.1 hypothetical protein B0P05DRAFT_564449 [Gilbertella persicaria]